MAADSTSSVKKLWGEDRDAKRVSVVMVVALILVRVTKLARAAAKPA